MVDIDQGINHAGKKLERAWEQDSSPESSSSADFRTPSTGPELQNFGAGTEIHNPAKSAVTSLPVDVSTFPALQTRTDLVADGDDRDPQGHGMTFMNTFYFHTHC